MKTLGRNIEELETWMPCPNANVEYPGLAYICPLDELIVMRKSDALHNVIGKNYTNYTICNNVGQKVFLAVQKNHYRRFDLKVFNFYGNEVMHFKRPYKFCINRVLVWAPPGNHVGSVEQNGWRKFQVRNRCGGILKMKSRSYFRFVYDILDNNEEIGVVMKWKKYLDVKSFRVLFPVHMNVADKVVILGAAFLIARLKY